MSHGALLPLCALVLMSLLPVGESRAARTDASRLLEAARTAAIRLDYTGTLLQQQGPALQTSRITHIADARGGTERVQLLEGPPREYVRRGAELTWYLPDERRMVHDHLAGMHSFPALSFVSAQGLLVHYKAAELGSDRVAGRTASLLQLTPNDGLRYGYRFWFDTATGILLRAQSISETGQVVAQTGFSQLAVGSNTGTRWRRPLYDTRGWKTESALSGKADLSGWSFRLPDGFQQLVALRRVIVQQASGTGKRSGAIREVSQVICSDGLAGISLFIEPWSESRSLQPVQQGAINMLGKRVGEFWLTIVGEVPMAALRQIADSLEFTDPQSNNSQ